jgi:NAD-dependent SIR2 family protein deacetylase
MVSFTDHGRGPGVNRGKRWECHRCKGLYQRKHCEGCMKTEFVARRETIWAPQMEKRARCANELPSPQFPVKALARIIAQEGAGSAAIFFGAGSSFDINKFSKNNPLAAQDTPPVYARIASFVAEGMLAMTTNHDGAWRAVMTVLEMHGSFDRVFCGGLCDDGKRCTLFCPFDEACEAGLAGLVEQALWGGFHVTDRFVDQRRESPEKEEEKNNNNSTLLIYKSPGHPRRGRRGRPTAVAVHRAKDYPPYAKAEELLAKKRLLVFVGTQGKVQASRILGLVEAFNAGNAGNKFVFYVDFNPFTSELAAGIKGLSKKKIYVQSVHVKSEALAFFELLRSELGDLAKDPAFADKGLEKLTTVVKPDKTILRKWRQDIVRFAKENPDFEKNNKQFPGLFTQILVGCADYIVPQD